MQLKVLLFGPAAASAGARSLDVSVREDATTDQVLTAIGEHAPRLKPMVDASKGARLAVNHAFAQPNQRIAPTDELALISMVSGG